MPRKNLTPEERLARKKASDKSWRERNHARKQANDRLYHERNRERLLVQMRERRIARLATMTPEELRAQQDRLNANQKAYEKRHPDRVKATQEKYYNANAEEIRAYQRNKRAADPEKARAYGRAYYAANQERDIAKQLAYAKKYPDRINARIEKRNARIAGASRNDLTLEQRNTVLALKRGVCDYCPHYNPGCKLCQKGKHKLSIDHITPVARGGDNTLWNVTACCRSCNSRKRLSPVPIPVQPLLL